MHLQLLLPCLLGFVWWNFTVHDIYMHEQSTALWTCHTCRSHPWRHANATAASIATYIFYDCAMAINVLTKLPDCRNINFNHGKNQSISPWWPADIMFLIHFHHVCAHNHQDLTYPGLLFNLPNTPQAWTHTLYCCSSLIFSIFLHSPCHWHEGCTLWTLRAVGPCAQTLWSWKCIWKCLVLASCIKAYYEVRDEADYSLSYLFQWSGSINIQAEWERCHCTYTYAAAVGLLWGVWPIIIGSNFTSSICTIY